MTHISQSTLLYLKTAIYISGEMPKIELLKIVKIYINVVMVISSLVTYFLLPGHRSLISETHSSHQPIMDNNFLFPELE